MSEAPFKLVVRTGPNPGMVFELTKEVTLVGRDVTNDIPLGDPEVSRQHARLTSTPGGYVVEDLGSTNGSFVNGERLVAPRVLSHGDLLGFGENVTLIFEGAGPVAAATVMGEAAKHGAPPSPAAYQAPPAQPAAPAAPPIQAVEPEEGRRGSLPWILAGVGCLVLLLACAATLWFMPASWWDVLLSPLEALGLF